MADRTIYPQKILTDQDLSQNDILNVRNISNNKVIEVKSEEKIEISSGNFKESIDKDSGIELKKVTPSSQEGEEPTVSSSLKIDNSSNILIDSKEASTTIEGTNANLKSATTTIEGTNANLKSDTTIIEGNNAEIKSTNIKLDNSDPEKENSILKIKGRNNLEITSDYSYDTQDASKKSSLVSSNYVEVKEELFSDNIRVHWDTATNSLVFEKK